jgi:AMP-polyphosphate phosphotransferase
VNTTSFWTVTEDALRRPEFWRYHQAMPRRGHVGILFGSWYTEPIVERALGDGSKERFNERMEDIHDLEEMLALDGAIFLKMWFHISKSEMKKRLKQVEKHPELHWYLVPQRKELSKAYDRFKKVSDKAIDATDAPMAEWHFVESHDDRHRNLTVAKLLLEALEKAGSKENLNGGKIVGRVTQPVVPSVVSRLAQVDLTQRYSDAAYDELLPKYQTKLLRLSWKMRERNHSLLAVFEGWDAAGKGGAIRRVTAGLDPRLYQTVGYAAPTQEEREHHYLWRFWRHLPLSGQTTIYDRSHYGRVLVERVEGFARVDEWARAYNEINAFEKQLTQGNVTVAKFWLHISADEQLRRFKERAEVKAKNYKITDEDWRNRKKWPLYEQAVEDMLARTSTEYAPWTVVAANDKRFARITVLRTLCRALEEALAD